MPQTEDERIQAEIAKLNREEIVNYIAKQETTMIEITNNPEATLEQLRSRLRIPRKRALTAAKSIFTPREYNTFLKRINKIGPMYLSSEECKKHGIVGRPNYLPFSPQKHSRKKAAIYDIVRRSALYGRAKD